MQASRALSVFLAVATILAATNSIGQPDIPDALQPWQDRVLHSQEYRACPTSSGSMPG